MRRTRTPILVALTLVAGLVLTLVGPAAAQRRDPPEDTLLRYAEDTWRSFAAMADTPTGLPADNIDGDLAVDSQSAYTSPTNVGSYLWSTIAARDLRIISRAQAHQRMGRVLDRLARLERHEPSGMFYNWYDPATGDKLTIWPDNGSTVEPFLSSVDNGWLAAGLEMVANAEPRLASKADRLFRSMDLGYYYDPDARPDIGVGLLRGGFWDEEPSGCFVADNYRGDADVFFTCHHYGAFNTEPRITSYLGIAKGEIPREHYFAGWRTFPDTCDWGWQEMKPVGAYQTYLGISVFEGAYTYRGIRLVPTWGGSMFEALMVPLLVPEEEWGPRSWGANHPLYVQAQIEHGLEEADYGYWGFSPASDPDGGYREYGVDPLGMDGPGYQSDQERTSVDYGFEGCRDPQPPPESYGRGVVTPHASFLALDFKREEAMLNLAKLEADFGKKIYGRGGFYDSIDVVTGVVAVRYLALDQGMIMAAIANDLGHDRLQRYLATPQLRRALRPLMALETFNTGGP